MHDWRSSQGDLECAQWAKRVDNTGLVGVSHTQPLLDEFMQSHDVKEVTWIVCFTNCSFEPVPDCDFASLNHWIPCTQGSEDFAQETLQRQKAWLRAEVNQANTIVQNCIAARDPVLLASAQGLLAK